MDTNTERRSPITEEPLRLPGQGLDEKLRTLAWNDGLGLLIPATFAWVSYIGSVLQRWAGAAPLHWILFGCAVLLTVRLAFGLRRLERLAKNYKLGRQGERAVGQLLQTIDLPGTRVFHDIPADGFNIDHVVVCDRGIYVVETKTWSKGAGERVEAKNGQILLRGRPVRGNPVGQAAHAARWLARLLEEQTGTRYVCQAVVVLPGWFVESVDAETKKQAWVLAAKALPGWMKRDAARLTGEEIRRVEGAITRHVRSRIRMGDD